MTAPKFKTSVASTLTLTAGCALIFGSLLLTIVFPRLHIGVAIVIGAVLGTPLLVLGMRLQSPSPIGNDAANDAGPAQSFWPDRAELARTFWGIVAFATFVLCYLGTLFVLAGLAYLLRSGDSPTMVAVRLLVLVGTGIGIYYWFRFVATRFPLWFRGKLSDETLATLMRHEPSPPPADAWSAAKRYWQLPVVALIAGCIMFGLIDFQAKWLDIPAGAKRTRGLLKIIQWCRGNPNTIQSSAALAAVATATAYGLLIYRADKRARLGQPASLNRS